MRLTYQRNAPGHISALLSFRDGDVVRRFKLATISRIDRLPWVVRISSEATPIDPGDPIRRNKLSDAKTELEARLFVAIAGQRNGGPVVDCPRGALGHG